MYVYSVQYIMINNIFNYTMFSIKNNFIENNIH